ncbi:helix-turn-helix transcriptional regulator [Halalkalicoccus jeotgali]|uniref:PadR family transcriptional regulator n=1 Tax=Halalkalicoccus jeotgali (strain DSM 18796 / CECT 7217 / JCM 14584 / KCTC 4019 / B3) TaxID=795797 RepID=D8JBJ0_HALJB|nr:helix-turn-helix transcriptional regulator [Halalkalicoccus jeotgali]ADJ16643.1 transcriptional regulator, PadR-like family protein [Halalkalicoccus jeotgali B3]ELY39093.1 PadR family transcriptional regulator [Halalkalicoccus jeotgali B3]
MYDLTGFQRDLLYVVAGKNGPNGLAVKAELEEYYESEVAHSRLYQNFDRLIEKGLVEKGRSDRRANYYVLPDRGRREIDTRREWENQYVTVPVVNQPTSTTATADE